MITNTKKNREIILAIITAIIILGAAIFTVIIEPQLNERKLCLARMEQLKLKLIKIKRDMLIKDRVDKIYSQIESLFVSNGTEQQERSVFTRELIQLYSGLRINIKTMNMLPTSNEEFYKRLSVRIEMSGPIQEILRFINAVETYPNPIKIEQLEISAREIVDNVSANFLFTKIIANSRT